jgi:methylthioribose-1-phosphate isomerase
MDQAFAIKIEKDKLIVLDQKKLPNTIEYIEVNTV